ncbi:hypothetical protein [Clostridium folliculivorans]|uniref:Uncharacterized protein n=1 Tax=Clostridium folliculivorans TaxID=2886038 RepID=A0A9W6D9R4_9CLOT|nr:hypothetical protein [Clostridium folliculivorans]GKU24181.1 hypothetical protein CFOLD11_10070 [Clostridium folliculivorans]GKU30286.1 hypothetical protein CFB3_23930 [Clostridium folliculivorans]
MDKVINIEDMILFKKACEVLRENKISFNDEKLRNNPDLCKAVIRMLGRYE